MESSLKSEFSPQCYIEPYIAPVWAQHLPDIPEQRIKLAQLPTPIHKWDLPGVPEGFEVLIKRDDLTGSVCSGNKIRKLEFILAEAMRQGCKHILTAGGPNSNHCRATAIACAQVGLECHLIIDAGNKTPDEIRSTGNMFLNKLCGANIYLIRESYTEQAIWPPQFELAENIREKTGEKVYIMPVGGSDKTGSFGYMEAYNEMLKQGIEEKVTDIILANGTGGTMSGLAVANFLAGNSNKIRLHAVRMIDIFSKQYFHDHLNALFHQHGIDNVKSEEIVNVLDDYIWPGYSKMSEEGLALIRDTAVKTGIALDPTYTAKGALGLVTEMQKNPTIFKGNRILFLHTGGIFGATDNVDLLNSVDTSARANIYTLSDFINK